MASSKKVTGSKLLRTGEIFVASPGAPNALDFKYWSAFQWLLDRRKDMERTTTYVGWLWLVTTDSLLHNNSWNIMICHDNNINIIVVTCCYMLLLLIVDFPGGYTIPIMPLQAPPMISIISKTSRVLATRTRSPGKDSWKFPQKHMLVQPAPHGTTRMTCLVLDSSWMCICINWCLLYPMYNWLLTLAISPISYLLQSL